MERLELHRRGAVVAAFAVEDRPVEIGRQLGCDIVIDDPSVAPRHWLVARQMGTVVAYDLTRRGRHRARARPVPLERPWAIGGDYALVRRQMVRSQAILRDQPADAHPTHAIARSGADASRLQLVLMRGSDPLHYRVDERPVQIGRAPGNDVVLSDQRVSAFHCRLEPLADGVLLRDLGSRNGTFVQGVRVERAVLTVGARVRIGGTDLRLMDADRPALLPGGPRLVAASSQMLGLLEEVQRLAGLPWPVLVHGESGTGKEGIANGLHALGPRSAEPLVALNAGGVARELVESELFGHERGAFTGAAGVHRGVFEQADGGTLFLDEIGELPLALQARLLRVLETGEIRRVGAEESRRVSVRLVCATHRDLREMVAAGRFRQDLYYRIARLVLDVPALRDRPADIEPLALHFLEEIAAEVGPRRLTREARAVLLGYDWPGNARELRNVLCAAAAATSAADLCASDVEHALARVGAMPPVKARLPVAALQGAIVQNGGNLSAAARALGIPRSTLRGRLRSANQAGQN